MSKKTVVSEHWAKCLAKYPTDRDAWADGYSLTAIGEELGVSRQRIWNQIQGPAPISARLWNHLIAHYGLKKDPIKE